MRTDVTVASKKLYETIRDLDYLGLDDLPKAVYVFNEYADKKIILNGIFVDNTWLLSDEYQRVWLNFSIDEIAFKKSTVFNQIRYDEFISYIKMYVVRLLGSYVTHSIQSFIRELKEIIKSFDGINLNSNIKLQEGRLLYDFVEMLDMKSSNEYERLLIVLDEILDENAYKSAPNRRRLSTFQSYFKFNDLIDEFWDRELTTNQRIFYFPLCLWWHITTILPLRPREFLLIPRDCFRDKKNRNQLTLRRTNLKGSNKKVCYSIADDYSFYQYDIGDSIAEQVRLYIDLTDNLEPNKLDTLFRADIHYDYLGKSKRYDSRLFTYTNMRYCLKRFYTDIIQNELMYDVKCVSYPSEANPINSEGYGLKDNEIEYINLGDTRHIAMINIIASGGTPTTAMMLAGHTNIDISSHYFANISTLIECKTYQNYLKSIDTIENKHVLNVNNNDSFISSANYTQVGNHGKCYSEHYSKGDYRDCFKTVGDDGELGECFNCSYYRSGDFRIFIDDKDIYTKQIADDCEYLADQLNRYRQSKGYKEDIKQAILRLQNSTKTYEKYFMSSLLQRGE